MAAKSVKFKVKDGGRVDVHIPERETTLTVDGEYETDVKLEQKALKAHPDVQEVKDK